jgi:hypothetical protein
MLLSRRLLLTALLANVPLIRRVGRLLSPVLADTSAFIEASVADNDQGLLPTASTEAYRGYWFTDVASRSSFAYRSNNDFTGRKYFPQPMCGGVGVIDYDNDGRMDLFFTNGAKLP